jgi:hypothetical protein
MNQNEKMNSVITELSIKLPEGLDLNKMLVEQGGESIQSFVDHEIRKETIIAKSTNKPILDIHNEQKISLETEHLLFEVLGLLPLDFGEMNICLHISNKSALWKYRQKINLYDYRETEKLCMYMQEIYQVDAGILEVDLLTLTRLLEEHRDQIYLDIRNKHGSLKRSELSPVQEAIALDILQEKDLLNRINKLIGNTGIIGEEKNRMAMFIIASSYKMPYSLHGIVQGVSGSGKSHLINSISSSMPQEDVLDLTRITPKSLYNFNEDDLMNKVFIIQDFDGVDQEAQLAFRELQSLGYINSLCTKKDRYGNHLASQRKVKAHFSSLVATTHSNLYYDTLSRSILLGIDESERQTDRIIEAQSSLLAGSVSKSDHESASLFLRNIIRVLKSYEVINPYAPHIKLPVESKMKRRLNQQFQYFVAQITLLHQFQRDVDKQNRIISTVEDIKQAIKYFFEPVVLKVDELDSSTRQFFENLKIYVNEKGRKSCFIQREVRLSLKLAKTRLAWYIKQLLELEYIEIVDGSSNRGYKYKITYWDDQDKLKKYIQENLYSQLEKYTDRTQK